MSDSELLSDLYITRLERWMGAATDALAIFEFVTTLDQEVSAVWKRKRSGASLLLLAVRYTMLAGAIQDLCGLRQLSYQGCVDYFITGDILVLVGDLLTPIFSALRVYALCGGSVRFSVITFLLQLSPFIVNIYGSVGNTYSTDQLFGCLVDNHFSSKTEEILLLASRIPLTLGDAFVVVITWVRSFQHLRMQRNLGMHLPLSTLLFRDGTAYFIILLVLNILQVCPLTSYYDGFVISDLNASIPLILVNRFMLNLRQLSDDEAHSVSHTRTITTPMFHMSVDITGNMGESLDHGWEHETSGVGGAGLQDGQQDDEVEMFEILQGDERGAHGALQDDGEAR